MGRFTNRTRQAALHAHLTHKSLTVWLKRPPASADDKHKTAGALQIVPESHRGHYDS